MIQPQSTVTIARRAVLRQAAQPLQRRLASGGGGYNQPSGRLFAEQPPAPGHKRAKEDWEALWTWGMFGGMAFGAVLLWYKPDTSVQTWAMKEAKERLEASGEVWQYKPSPNSGYPNGV